MKANVATQLPEEQTTMKKLTANRGDATAAKKLHNDTIKKRTAIRDNAIPENSADKRKLTAERGNTTAVNEGERNNATTGKTHHDEEVDRETWGCHRGKEAPQ